MYCVRRIYRFRNLYRFRKCYCRCCTLLYLTSRTLGNRTLTQTEYDNALAIENICSVVDTATGCFADGTIIRPADPLAITNTVATNLIATTITHK
jgi:hypothetical protein